MPKNPGRHYRRRRYYSPMMRVVESTSEKIYTQLSGARSVAELRNRLTKIAQDDELWRALNSLSQVMKRLEHFQI